LVFRERFFIQSDVARDHQYDMTFKKNFLLYLDHSPVSFYAAKYLADIFGNTANGKVT